MWHVSTTRGSRNQQRPRLPRPWLSFGVVLLAFTFLSGCGEVTPIWHRAGRDQTSPAADDAYQMDSSAAAPATAPSSSKAASGGGSSDTASFASESLTFEYLTESYTQAKQARKNAPGPLHAVVSEFVDALNASRPGLAAIVPRALDSSASPRLDLYAYNGPLLLRSPRFALESGLTANVIATSVKRLLQASCDPSARRDALQFSLQQLSQECGNRDSNLGCSKQLQSCAVEFIKSIDSEICILGSRILPAVTGRSTPTAGVVRDAMNILTPALRRHVLRRGVDQFCGCEAAGLPEAPTPVHGYLHKRSQCITGANIQLVSKVSLQECRQRCNAEPACVAIEYGVSHGGAGPFEPMDCQLNSASQDSPTDPCDGNYENLDLYINVKRANLEQESSTAHMEFRAQLSRQVCELADFGEPESFVQFVGTPQACATTVAANLAAARREVGAGRGRLLEVFHRSMQAAFVEEKSAPAQKSTGRSKFSIAQPSQHAGREGADDQQPQQDQQQQPSPPSAPPPLGAAVAAADHLHQRAEQVLQYVETPTNPQLEAVARVVCSELYFGLSPASSDAAAQRRNPGAPLFEIGAVDEVSTGANAEDSDGAQVEPPLQTDAPDPSRTLGSMMRLAQRTTLRGDGEHPVHQHASRRARKRRRRRRRPIAGRSLLADAPRFDDAEHFLHFLDSSLGGGLGEVGQASVASDQPATLDSRFREEGAPADMGSLASDAVPSPGPAPSYATAGVPGSPSPAPDALPLAGAAAEINLGAWKAVDFDADASEDITQVSPLNLIQQQRSGPLGDGPELLKHGHLSSNPLRVLGNLLFISQTSLTAENIQTFLQALTEDTCSNSLSDVQAQIDSFVLNEHSTHLLSQVWRHFCLSVLTPPLGMGLDPSMPGVKGAALLRGIDEYCASAFRMHGATGDPCAGPQSSATSASALGQPHIANAIKCAFEKGNPVAGSDNASMDSFSSKLIQWLGEPVISRAVASTPAVFSAMHQRAAQLTTAAVLLREASLAPTNTATEAPSSAPSPLLAPGSGENSLAQDLDEPNPSPGEESYGQPTMLLQVGRVLNGVLQRWLPGESDPEQVLTDRRARMLEETEPTSTALRSVEHRFSEQTTPAVESDAETLGEGDFLADMTPSTSSEAGNAAAPSPSSLAIISPSSIFAPVYPSLQGDLADIIASAVASDITGAEATSGASARLDGCAAHATAMELGDPEIAKAEAHMHQVQRALKQQVPDGSSSQRAQLETEQTKTERAIVQLQQQHPSDEDSMSIPAVDPAVAETLPESSAIEYLKSVPARVRQKAFEQDKSLWRQSSWADRARSVHATAGDDSIDP